MKYLILSLTFVLSACAVVSKPIGAGFEAVRAPAQNTGDIGKSDSGENSEAVSSILFARCQSENYSEDYIFYIDTKREVRQKVIANLSAIKITRQIDQTQLAKEYSKIAADQTFENQSDMKLHFNNSEIFLQTAADQNPMIFNAKEKNLKLLDIKNKKITTLNCDFRDSH